MANESTLEHDIYLFHEGNLRYSYRLLGAHPDVQDGVEGIRFAVWAPNAVQVSVVGIFNEWDGRQNPMEKVNDNGIWMAFIPNLEKGTIYKYEILTAHGHLRLKADPYAFSSELRPDTASVVYPLDNYTWNDDEWMKERKAQNIYESPVSIYELHLGSWKYIEPEVYYNYREYADMVIPYVKDLGYTHIELLPIMEHPFDRSWGYQTTGYFGVTSRYGSPDDFKYFVDQCHQHGLGVILDWVPGHFCKDEHGLRRFDGEALYEYQNPSKAEKTQWGTLTFDFGRSEVHSFLISNAIYWLKEYHLDGLRVDAVASMLYLDFGKNEGEWELNEYGGRENIEAVSFIKKMNEAVFEEVPDTLMMAEESTSWPLVSSPTYIGGLGFNYKWNMGWMNDSLDYMQQDPLFRKYHHHKMTFSMVYAFSENYILPLSHDEVVHGKGSLLNKMPGDDWQQFANLRAYYAFMWAHPGKKLLFMGAEIAQRKEWDHDHSLDWHLLEHQSHQGIQHTVKRLNQVYQAHPSLYELDSCATGFSWIDNNNSQQSMFSFIRYAKNADHFMVIVANFTPTAYQHYTLGVPAKGTYKVVLNTDEVCFFGSGYRVTEDKNQLIHSVVQPSHGFDHSITVNIGGLTTLYLEKVNDE